MSAEIDALFEDDEGDGGLTHRIFPSEQEDLSAQDVSMTDLFGDVAPSDVPVKRPPPSASSSALHLPRYPRLMTSVDGKTSRVAVVRLPRVVTIAPQAFEPETFNEQVEDAWLKSIDKSGAGDAVIRFRLKREEDGSVAVDEQGRPIRESNSKIIEWNDGSLTLHVGNECFSLRQAAAAASSAGGECDYIYSRVVSVPPAVSAETQAPPRETLLAAQAPVAWRLTAGALSNSGAINLAALELREKRSRAVKRERVKQIVITEDPEQAKLRRIKEEDEAARLERKVSEAKEKARSRSGGDGYNSSFLRNQNAEDEAEGRLDEDDNEESSMNISKIRRDEKSRKGRGRQPVLSKKRRVSGNNDNDDDEEEEDDDDEDDDDRKFIVHDEDEEDDDDDDEEDDDD
jgi:RNA polymerase-associated protein LEO1